MKHIQTIPQSAYSLSTKANQKLSHLPGPKGHWLTGNLRDLGSNPQPFLTNMRAQYGDCFTFGFLGNQRRLVMTGPEAFEQVFIDRDNNFSSHLGWDIVHEFFGQNILVRDFEDHRLHRKLMTPLFKPAALAKYLEQMRPSIDAALETYVGPVDVYQQTKVMALDIAIRVFAGLTQKNVDDWNEDLNTVLSNVMAHRIRLPGTRYWAALSARNRLQAKLKAEILHRRGSKKEDLFSQLINNTDEQGRTLSDQDIVDHMFGLLFAAHDTTASSIAMMFWLLAKHPQLQEAARKECIDQQAHSRTDHLDFEDLPKLPIIDAIFNETLRCYAPIQLLPRRNLREFAFQGHKIPANTAILLAPQVTHFDPDIYSEPDNFNPKRFMQTTPAPFTFIPFGKGSHMCLGMHFAYMEIKAVLYRVLTTRQLTLPQVHTLDLEYLPIVRPREAMTVQFQTI